MALIFEQGIEAAFCGQGNFFLSQYEKGGGSFALKIFLRLFMLFVADNFLDFSWWIY